MRHPRTAILGAGLTGTCAALELARRGHDVDLYDENADALMRASYNNEGKIHVGLVYAADRSLKSAEVMIRGAVHFYDCLTRWIDLRADDLPLSTPYYYAVHEGTMVTVEDLERHYRGCERLFAQACAATGLRYLGTDRALLVERLDAAETARVVSRDHCIAAFRTSERAVDPRRIAEAVRRALHANPRVRFMPRSEVRGVARGVDGRFDVTVRCDGFERTEPYDRVANALWHGRLRIDADLGLAPERQWIHRYKLGGWRMALADAAVPSLTFVLGPFGDVVNFGGGGLYVSWYPNGMVGSSRELMPPDWERGLCDADRQHIVRCGYEELAARCPSLPRLNGKALQTVGGVIVAWGEADIDHAESRLHTRHEIGIHSAGHYHSVNTGKYTMAPYLGLKTAERLLGLS